jgi:hypothetical protein
VNRGFYVGIYLCKYAFVILNNPKVTTPRQRVSRS